MKNETLALEKWLVGCRAYRIFLKTGIKRDHLDSLVTACGLDAEDFSKIQGIWAARPTQPSIV
jgi:hypothetical protein